MRPTTNFLLLLMLVFLWISPHYSQAANSQTSSSTSFSTNIEFSGCKSTKCKPAKVEKYKQVIHSIEEYYSKYNTPNHRLTLEAKMMVISNAIRMAYPDLDFIGFYHFHPDRGDHELQLGAYSARSKTPQFVFRNGEGIVGTSWKTLEPQLAKNIPKIKGHVTYDWKIKSEVTVPSFDLDGNFNGVIYLFSERPYAVDETDIVCLEDILHYLDY